MHVEEEVEKFEEPAMVDFSDTTGLLYISIHKGMYFKRNLSYCVGEVELLFGNVKPLFGFAKKADLWHYSHGCSLVNSSFCVLL